jgi:hypothetical protein
MGKDGANGSSRRRAMDSRSDGGEVQEERVELSGPRVVRRAVKLRFGGVGAPGPAPAAARAQPAPRVESPRPTKRASSRPPPEMKIELRSVPPQHGGTRLRRLPSLRPRRAGASIDPGSGTNLWPGVALLLASIAIGLAGHSLQLELGPVRPAWIAGTLMVAGISLLVYQLWPRDH